MAATTVRRQTVRKDPIARLVDPGLAWMLLDNEDPERSYTQVQRNSMEISRYQARGYEVETYRPGGVKPRVIRNVEGLIGKEIEIRDCVLMSIPKAEKLAQEAAGKELADSFYRRIHNKKAVREETFERDIPFRRNESGEPLMDVEDISSPLRVRNEESNA